MRDVLEQQLQEKAVQERAHKQHESDCFPANHTVRQPQDMSRPWATTTQLMSAQQEVRAAKATRVPPISKCWSLGPPGRHSPRVP